MKIAVMYREGGTWGEQIVGHLRGEAPSDWQLQLGHIPEQLPAVLEDPAEHLPGDVPEADLLLMLPESSPAVQLVPELARAAGVSEVIVPVDDEAILPLGLQNQIRRTLESMDVEVAFPSPFCTLTVHHGRGPFIRAFAERFGRPELAAVPDEDGEIEGFSVERCAPCGNTAYVVEQVRGLGAQAAEKRGPLVHQFYPCLASHDLIYRSALVTRAALRAAARRYRSEMKEGRT